ncbi:Uncharacterised protein [Mycobacterium tuberculosis]|nr:Uncharacterised protein [Mycobacterium tuberculosis]
MERSSRAGLRSTLTVVLAIVGTMLSVTVGVATNIATNLIPNGWGWARDPVIIWTGVGALSVVAALVAALHVHLGAKPESTPQDRMPMPAGEIQERYTGRAVVERAVRLVPREGFDPDGRLGLPSRAYVFIGDYDEQRHRTLRQILSNLWIGDAFEQIENSNVAWLALIFEVGELNPRKLDLLPATWKATFRILSDPKRAARFVATDEELIRLGRPPRDYYSDDQNWWYGRCATAGRRWTGRGPLIEEVLGISWACFSGTGITNTGPRRSSGIPSRVFFVKNLPLSSVTYRVQELGVPDDDIVLE